MPFRGRLRETDRGDARADRTPASALDGRAAAAVDDLQHLSSRRQAAAAADFLAGLSKIGIAVPGSRIGTVDSAPTPAGCDGSADAETGRARVHTSRHSGAWRETQTGGPAAGMRAARIHTGDQRR